ncbi:MAG: hypothetical protein DI606_13420 [Sphingobium sp.]|uniref:hypothetical protein n=1 Tax=Sphingobium sp. TaxID=1912891 RepID=UPI000DB4F064|nr:hypothetical protein [Sphingobium sp.]PZU09943.1 MAG: hypothetical protein DI606_13420 [Sphingobium sp.]
MAFFPAQLFTVKPCSEVREIALAKEIRDDSDLLLLTGDTSHLGIVLTGSYAGRGYGMADIRSDAHLICEGVEFEVDLDSAFQPAFIRQPAGALNLSASGLSISFIKKDGHGFDKLMLSKFGEQNGSTTTKDDSVGFTSWRLIKRVGDQVYPLFEFKAAKVADR